MFRVEEGAIVAGTLKQPIPHNEFLCTTKEYANFDLCLKAKLVGDGDNAGIQFRSKRVPNHHEVSGYQCDMGTANRTRQDFPLKQSVSRKCHLRRLAGVRHLPLEFRTAGPEHF